MRQRIPFRRIDVHAAAELLRSPDVLKLDARDAASFAESHVTGAQPVSSSNLSIFISGTAKNRPILIYCYHGNASQEYAQTFSDFGFSEVYSLDGGFEAVKNASHPAGTPLRETTRRWLAAQGFPSDEVNIAIANGMTPLMKAAHAGETAILRDLLGAGARLEAKNADGNNALWLACVGGHLDIIDLLIDAGIDIDNGNVNGATALMYASSSGKAAVVARLLAKGAAIAPETPDGFSALDMAASAECLALLRNARRQPQNQEHKS